MQLLGRQIKEQIKESEGRNDKAHDGLRTLIKESEGRNDKAHDGLRTLIKESEGRNKDAHAELGARIENGFNRLNDTLMKMNNDMGFIRGRQERDERNARGQQPGDPAS